MLMALRFEPSRFFPKGNSIQIATANQNSINQKSFGILNWPLLAKIVYQWSLDEYTHQSVNSN